MQVLKSAERRRPRKGCEIDVIVLGAITRSDKPVKAYDIVRQSTSSGDPLLPVQVYRSLDRLKAEGTIERVATLNAFVSSEMDHSMHLLCVDCGSFHATEAFEAYEILERLCSSVGFKPLQPYIEISGHCSRCEKPSKD